MIEGSGCIYNFELNDGSNKHYYQIYSSNFQSALELAQRKFVKLYGNKSIHVVKNITGFPITRNY